MVGAHARRAYATKRQSLLRHVQHHIVHTHAACHGFLHALLNQLGLLGKHITRQWARAHIDVVYSGLYAVYGDDGQYGPKDFLLHQLTGLRRGMHQTWGEKIGALLRQRQHFGAVAVCLVKPSL